MAATVQLRLPLDGGSVSVNVSVTEETRGVHLARELVLHHGIPEAFEAPIAAAVDAHVRQATQARLDEIDRQTLDRSAEELHERSLAWAALFREEHAQFRTADAAPAPDGDEAFLAICQQVVCSVALRPLLLLEQTYANEVLDLIVKRDRGIAEMRTKHEGDLRALLLVSPSDASADRRAKELADIQKNKIKARARAVRNCMLISAADADRHLAGPPGGAQGAPAQRVPRCHHAAAPEAAGGHAGAAAGARALDCAGERDPGPAPRAALVVQQQLGHL